MSIRWTGQRKRIWEAIRGRTDHPTAEELYQELRARGETISLATVYRALRTMAREGLIRELKGPGPDRFDPNTHPHYHFRCKACGRVFDVEVPYREELDALEIGQGFDISGHEITWVGLCPVCRGKEE